MKLCMRIVHYKSRKSEAAFDAMVPFGLATGRENFKNEPFDHFTKFALTVISIVFSCGFRFSTLIDLVYKVQSTVEFFYFLKFF